ERRKVHALRAGCSTQWRADFEIQAVLAGGSAVMQNVENDGVRRWAQGEDAQAGLGGARRTSRGVQMIAPVMESRAGKVSQVFRDGAERKGAYRLLENDEVQPESLINAAGCACAKRSVAYPYVIVPTDGSSATLADPIGELGSVGTYA